jgi:hypothetical protein
MAIRLKANLRETRAELDRDFEDVLTKLDQMMGNDLLNLDKIKDSLDTR